MDKVQYFQIPVDDMERARKFYLEVFGWEIHSTDMEGNYHAVHTVPIDENGMPKEPGGINGGLFERSAYGLQGVSIVINVASIDDYIKKIESTGGETVAPKTKVGDIGFYATVKDTEGNAIGIWENIG